MFHLAEENLPGSHVSEYTFPLSQDREQVNHHPEMVDTTQDLKRRRNQFRWRNSEIERQEWDVTSTSRPQTKGPHKTRDGIREETW